MFFSQWKVEKLIYMAERTAGFSITITSRYVDVAQIRGCQNWGGGELDIFLGVRYINPLKRFLQLKMADFAPICLKLPSLADLW